MSDNWFISNTGLCAWSFQQSADSRFEDPFMERMKYLLDNLGLRFPENSDVSFEVAEKIVAEPQNVTSDEWRQAGGFLDIDRSVLIKLQKGFVAFDKKETEAMEEIYGRFFLLDGRPRHARDNFTVRGEVPSFLKRQAA